MTVIALKINIYLFLTALLGPKYFLHEMYISCERIPKT